MSDSNPYSSPTESGWNPPPQTGTIRLARVNVLSCARILGVIYAAIGALAGAGMSLLTLFGASVSSNGSPGGLIFGGVMAIILLPIVYGIGGALSGAVMAVFYNIAASAVGGIELKID